MSKYGWVRVLVIVSCAAVLCAGCKLFAKKPKAEPPIYTAANPGPWKGVTPGILFNDKSAPVTIAISVTGYPRKGADYVRRLDLQDGSGTNVGTRVFDPVEEPTETFRLKPSIREVSVLITSTRRGRWRSRLYRVPEPAKRLERPLPPPVDPKRRGALTVPLPPR